MPSSGSKQSIILVVIVITIVSVLAFGLLMTDDMKPDPAKEKPHLQAKVEEIVKPVQKNQEEAIKSSEEAINNNSSESLNVSATTDANENAESKSEIKFEEGLDYVTKFPDEIPKEPVLIEFFSYMCPHCYNFEPTLKRWELQKPETVKLHKIPVTFGRSGPWAIAAKAFYIAEELNVVEQFGPLMFRKIHEEKQYPRQESDLESIFLALGIKSNVFKNAANSFNVDSNLRKAEFLTKKYKVTGVPYFQYQCV